MLFRRLPAGSSAAVELCLTDRHDGNFRIDNDNDLLGELRQGALRGEWSWLRQVHGATVAIVDAPGGQAGTEADASVTTVLGAVLCVQSADCVPIVLVGDGSLGVVHAGWRGVVAGVIPRAINAMRAQGSAPQKAIIGPCIRPHAYEFGEPELTLVAGVAGDQVRSWTSEGSLALDMGVAATEVLHRCGVPEVDDLGFDTAEDRWFSHRLRGDSGRQVTAARLVSP